MRVFDRCKTCMFENSIPTSADWQNCQTCGSNNISNYTPAKKIYKIDTLEDIQNALDSEFDGQVKLLSKRQDGTVNIKGLFDSRLHVRYFLKRIGVLCLNDIAEKRGYSAVIGISCAGIVKLNKLFKRESYIDKHFSIGKIHFHISWKSKRNLWGRFGSGWNWHLGIEWGKTACIIFLLVLSISIYYKK